MYIQSISLFYTGSEKWPFSSKLIMVLTEFLYMYVAYTAYTAGGCYFTIWVSDWDISWYRLSLYNFYEDIRARHCTESVQCSTSALQTTVSMKNLQSHSSIWELTSGGLSGAEKGVSYSQTRTIFPNSKKPVAKLGNGTTSAVLNMDIECVHLLKIVKGQPALFQSRAQRHFG